MSNRKTVKIILTGSIPSKKNSRINTRSGRSFPNKRYTQWHNSATYQILKQTRVKFEKPVAINITLFFDTKRRSDIDNKTASIFDTLTDCGIIVDDDWKHIPKLSVEAEYRRGNAGAIVEISEIVL